MWYHIVKQERIDYDDTKIIATQYGNRRKYGKTTAQRCME